MKSPLAGALFALTLSLAPPALAQPPEGCTQCRAVIDDIRATLDQRCEQVPNDDALRSQPIYLFLSIFDEVSQGIDAKLRSRIYQAALDGMECDNLDAGVAAAQRMSQRVMQEHRS